MELTNAQVALQASVHYFANAEEHIPSDSITGKASDFLLWLNRNTPEERPQDVR